MKTILKPIFSIFLFISLFFVSTSVFANDNVSMQYESPADSYLGMAKSSIGASTDIQTISGSNTRGLARAGSLGWGDDPFPGGWEGGGGGNVGYPIGDFSIAMIVGILVIYFVVRGVSSKKKKIM